MTYDKTDRKIISALRRQSDLRIVDYSARTGIPKSTVHDRLRKLVKGGVRCVPLIAWSRAGFPITAYFFLPYDDEAVMHYAVNTALRLSPDTLFLECIFSSVKEAESFKERFCAGRYYMAVEALKAEAFIPPP